MIELLRRVATDDPGRAAIVTDTETVDYGELHRRACAAATGLRARGISRFAVLDHDAPAVATLLAGASLAGAQACMYPPTDDSGDIDELAERFDHDLVIASGNPPAINPDVLTLGELLAAATDATGAPVDPPEQRPHLVLTTGTTGAPRGVRHDWNRLLRSTTRIAPAPDERWLLAYGLHQFAGLQILLHVFAAGATLVAPAPRRPREGLAAMRAHDVDAASATPTYWRFLLAELRADGGPVPRLRQITMGGEAIPGPLIGELERTFPDANISQVYAASEFGSSGSVRDRRAGLSLDVLHRGEDADVAMKIVDDELWVRSRTGMLGYYGEDAVDPDGWRPTGDLVDVVDDRIVFRGRRSEVINVGGVKVHPLPIEERLAGVPGVDMARVFGRPNAMTGAIVAIEVVPAPDADRDAIDAAIRAACADLPAAARPRSIRFVEAVSTAGDKIVRRQQ